MGDMLVTLDTFCWSLRGPGDPPLPGVRRGVRGIQQVPAGKGSAPEARELARTPGRNDTH